MFRALLRWLVRLFPRDFRDQFGGEMADHLDLNTLEMRSRGRGARVWWFLTVAGELAMTALAHRVRRQEPVHIVARLVAAAVGLVAATVLVATVLSAFEHLIRLPLLAYAKGNNGASPVPGLAALIAVILMLLAVYLFLFQRPRKWQQPTD